MGFLYGFGSNINEIDGGWLMQIRFSIIVPAY
jgi:hypothetical protein